MTILIILAIVGGIAMILIAGLSNRNEYHHRHVHHHSSHDKDHTPIKPRSILTLNEQPIFLKLRKAFPDCFVLTQVSLAALLMSCGQVTRNRFTRYRADFVILDKDFKVLAIIELDNHSHDGTEVKNDKMTVDAMLKEAGYRVLRYPHAPDIEKLQNDVIENVKRKRSTKFAQPLPAKQTNQEATQTDQAKFDEKSFFDKDY